MENPENNIPMQGADGAREADTAQAAGTAQDTVSAQASGAAQPDARQQGEEGLPPGAARLPLGGGLSAAF